AGGNFDHLSVIAADVDLLEMNAAGLSDKRRIADTSRRGTPRSGSELVLFSLEHFELLGRRGHEYGYLERSGCGDDGLTRYEEWRLAPVFQEMHTGIHTGHQQALGIGHVHLRDQGSASRVEGVGGTGDLAHERAGELLDLNRRALSDVNGWRAGLRDTDQ